MRQQDLIIYACFKLTTTHRLVDIVFSLNQPVLQYMVVFVCRENRRIEEVSIKLTNLQDNKQDITV